MSANSRPEEETVTKDGYELTFYPGFLSRAVIRERDGSEREIFRQTRTFHLPPGQTRPRTRHRLHLRGGRRKQNLSLEIHDPEYRVARITIELYGEDHDPERGTESASVETLDLENHPRKCPPDCG